MNKKTPFKKAQEVRTDLDSNANYITKTLNKNSDYLLKGTIDENMVNFLYEQLPKLFKIDEKEQAVDLLDILCNKLNYVIKKTRHYNIPFTKEEWFMYLYLIKQSSNQNVTFENLIDIIDINSIINEIKFKKEPLNKHYKILNNVISEVKANV
jgi:hypothetical protein